MNTPDENQASNGDFLSDIVIGMSDGLIVPFALSAGLSGAAVAAPLILLAGGITVALGSLVMAWGGYRAKADTATDAGEQAAKEKDFFARIGLSEEMQQKAAAEIVKDEQQWNEFISEEEASAGNSWHPGRAALRIGLSYAAGGLIALAPYYFVATPVTALQLSAVLTFFGLFALGFTKGRFTGTNPWGHAFRIAITGLLAGTAAFCIARLFENG